MASKAYRCFAYQAASLAGFGQAEQNTASPLLSVTTWFICPAAMVPSTRTWELQSPLNAWLSDPANQPDFYHSVFSPTNLSVWGTRPRHRRLGSVCR